MSSLLTAGLLNAAVASALAIVALIACRMWRNPFFNRGVWLAVLLKFVVPPLVLLPLVKLPAPAASDKTRASAEQRPAPSAADARAIELFARDLPRGDMANLAGLPKANVETMLDADRVADLQQLPTPIFAPAPTAPVAEVLPVVTAKSAPRAAAPDQAQPNPLTILAAVWLIGSGALALIAIIRIARFHLAIASARLAPARMQRRVRQLAAEAGLRRPPIVRLAAGRTPPLVWRVGLRSTILLPTKLLATLTAAETDAVIAHELTHLRRRDDRFRWFELAVVGLYWWCPLAWLARRRLQEAEERCCDAEALRTFPAVAAHYGRALLATLDFLVPPPRLAFGATALMDRGSLVRRFEMITSRRLPTPPSRTARTLLFVAAAALLATTPIALSAQADNDESATVVAVAEDSRVDAIEVPLKEPAVNADVAIDDETVTTIDDAPIADDSTDADAATSQVNRDRYGHESAADDVAAPGNLNRYASESAAAEATAPADESADRFAADPRFGVQPGAAALGLRAGPVKIELPDGRTIPAQIRLVGDAWVVAPKDARDMRIAAGEIVMPAAEPFRFGEAMNSAADENLQVEPQFLPRPRDAAAADPDALRIDPDWLATAESDDADPTKTPLARTENFSIWDLKLKECLDIALENSRAVVMTKQADGAIVLSRDATDGPQLDRSEFQATIRDKIRDVHEAYWDLYLAYRDLDAGKIGRDAALQSWRRVKTLQRAGSVGGEDNREAQARAQYYLYRSQVETALTNLFRVENRLRYLLGITPSDGKLIRPTDEPNGKHAKFEWEKIHAEALATRRELTQALLAVETRGTELQAAQAELQRERERTDASEVEIRRAEAALKHAQLQFNREQALLRDIELEISHQLGDAVRDVDLNFEVASTNAHRLAAAEDEVKSVEVLYEVGQIELDQLLAAQARRAEATSALYRSMTDYQRAQFRVEYSIGRVIEHFGYKVP